MNRTEFLPPDAFPQKLPRPVENSNDETVGAAPAARSETWRLIMQIGNDQRIFQTEISDQIIVGRSDPEQNFRAELDLTPFNGRGAGVSRRHLTIYLAHSVLYVRDLGSANGTLLNGVTLEAQRLYHLNEGDKITVGKLDVLLFSARPLGPHEGSDQDDNTTQNSVPPVVPER